MPTPCLETLNLTKHYKLTTALHGLSLQIQPGEIFGYLGPNGAGKTTTLRLILGLVRPSAGEVKIFGEAVVPKSKLSVIARNRIGYLPGELSLYSDITGIELFDYFARFRLGRSQPPLRQRLLDSFGLDKTTLRRRVKLLSHGTRQKLGLVIAMQHQPELLLLDEPTLGLDPLMQRAFTEIVRELAVQGATVFFSSHILSEVEDLCQRVGILRRGRLIALESIAALREKMVRRMTIKFADDIPELQQVPGVMRCERQGSEVVVAVRGPINPLLKILSNHPIDDLIFPEPELEDIFAHYYHDGDGEHSGATRSAP